MVASYFVQSLLRKWFIFCQQLWVREIKIQLVEFQEYLSLFLRLSNAQLFAKICSEYYICNGKYSHAIFFSCNCIYINIIYIDLELVYSMTFFLFSPQPNHSSQVYTQYIALTCSCHRAPFVIRQKKIKANTHSISRFSSFSFPFFMLILPFFYRY